MAIDCEDVSTRMMELLYGELPADERARIEAHVAGCARCRSEQEGFEKTRAAARHALDEAPPARVRAAIVKAAAEHLAAQAQPTARKPAASDKMSFWDRLRAAWAFPTLATVGALAVAVFLVANRTFQNPERALERAAPVEAPTTPALQPAPAAADPAKTEGRDRAAPEQARQERAGDEKKPASGGRADDYRELAKDAAGGGARHGAPKGDAPAARRSVSDNAVDGLDMEPPRGKRKAEQMPDLVSGKPAKKYAPAAEGEKSLRDQRGAETQFAPPPPPREAPVAAKAGKSADKVSAKEAAEDDALEGGEMRSAGPRRTAAKPQAPPPAGGSVAGLGGPGNKSDGYGSGLGQAAPAPRNEATTKRPAPAPAPVSAQASPPPAPAMKARPKSSADYDDEEMEAPAANAKKKEKKPASGRAGAVETLAQRADRLFAEGRWAEAAEAYRELLRQDPRSDDADRWRRRLVAAENADVSDRNASVAEKRAAEAKSARKAAPAKPQRSDKAAAASAPAADQ